MEDNVIRFAPVLYKNLNEKQLIQHAETFVEEYSKRNLDYYQQNRGLELLEYAVSKIEPEYIKTRFNAWIKVIKYCMENPINVTDTETKSS